MYVIIAGGGKIGRNLAKQLNNAGYEVTVIERNADRYALLEEELEHVVQLGDATELHVLEGCGIARADIVVAATGDDEDNVIVCQVARERYGVERIVARVNDPRNQEAFDLLGVSPTVCATSAIMALVQHELPEHDLVSLLSLRREQLEIVEAQITEQSPVAGRFVRDIRLPDAARLISVMRGGEAEIAVGDTELRAGDLVLAIAKPGMEPVLRDALVGKG